MEKNCQDRIKDAFCIYKENILTGKNKTYDTIFPAAISSLERQIYAISEGYHRIGTAGYSGADGIVSPNDLLGVAKGIAKMNGCSEDEIILTPVLESRNTDKGHYVLDLVYGIFDKFDVYAKPLDGEEPDQIDVENQIEQIIEQTD